LKSTRINTRFPFNSISSMVRIAMGYLNVAQLSNYPTGVPTGLYSDTLTIKMINPLPPL
jgi:hypothetical protein